MIEREITPLETLMLIAIGAILVETPPRRREAMLARIGAGVGDPSVVPIHDGDALRMRVAVRKLYEAMLPAWLAP